MTTSEGKAKHKYKYKLRFMPEALEEWRNLDGSVQANLKKLLAKRLDNPRVPGGELARTGWSTNLPWHACLPRPLR